MARGMQLLPIDPSMNRHRRSFGTGFSPGSSGSNPYEKPKNIGGALTSAFGGAGAMTGLGNMLGYTAAGSMGGIPGAIVGAGIGLASYLF
jgi:hypothetical protein